MKTEHQSKEITQSAIQQKQSSAFIDDLRPQINSVVQLVGGMEKSKPNMTAMPDSLKSGIENLSGLNMDDVRVHYNSDRPATIQAYAYTQGSDIHIAPSQERYLPHEAWHVVQQKQGRVRSTVQIAGVAVNDNSTLENEADRMGHQATIQRAAIDIVTSNDATIQRCKFCGDSTCKAGEKCGLDHTMGGLFGSQINPPFVGPHKETKKHSKRGVFESEHMIPKAALKHSGVQFDYETEPTISISYAMHREAMSGAGGGVTSTGSSRTATGWGKILGDQIKSGDWYSSIRSTAIDEYHAAKANRVLSENMVNGLCQVVNSHATMGRITVQQAGEIIQELMNLWYNE